MGCLIRNLHAVQPGQCFLLGVANIWSRLLKHNWWALVWGTTCPIRRYLWPYIQRKFTSVRLYQPYVARISAHACVWSAIMTSISSLWTALPLSGQLEIDRTETIRWNWSSPIPKEVVTPPGPRENQDTVERNGSYGWGIWRTIMETMGGNSSICIKINSWLR